MEASPQQPGGLDALRNSWSMAPEAPQQQAAQAPDVVSDLRSQLAVEDARRNRPLAERARERGEARRQERTRGLGNFFRNVGRMWTEAWDTAGGAVEIGAENVRDPQWRAEQYNKIDKKIAESRENSRLASAERKRKFNEGVNNAIDSADEWIDGVADDIEKRAVETAKKGVNIIGRELLVPLLNDVIQPAIRIVDRADLEISHVRTDVLNQVGGALEGVGGGAWDAIDNSPLGNALATAAEQYRERGSDRRGLGRIVTGLDNFVEDCRGGLERMFGFGRRMRNEAAQIRQEFGARHQANQENVRAAGEAATNIVKQGLI